MSTEPYSKRRFLALFVVPALLVLVGVLWPLISGSHTLFFRDVFNTHLEMKWLQAEAMAEGYLPLVDPYRSGGQAHTGNPNTVPLYPDNLLYKIAPFLWAFNAHFWLHLLLAPLAAYWLGRSLGLGRPGAWAAGLFYGVGGYCLSQLNLYNLIAPVALTPALVAAVVSFMSHQVRRWRLVAVAGLWCLMILGGDPMTAAIALGLALSVLWIVPKSRSSLARLSVAFAAGTLLAAPQWVEFLRIVELSFRGHWGYSAAGATVASWHPATALEWLIPFAFGRPDLAFWGHRFYSGTQPLFYSFYPGILALVCFVLGWRWNRPGARWALALVGLGVFLALGGFNPVMAWLLRLPFADVLRLPVKFWPLVALPAAIVAGMGFDRCLGDGGNRLLRRTALAVAAVCLTGWLVAHFAGSWLEGVIAGWMAPAFADSGLAAAERSRWAMLLARSTGLASVFGLATFVRPRLFALLAPALLVLHLGVQLAFLGPLLRSEPTHVYEQTPAPVLAIPAGAVAVHGAQGGAFGRVPIPASEYPSPDPRWLQRQVHNEAYPHVGMMARRRFEFALSPEGLDSFLTRAVAEALPLLSDEDRLRLLRASGVEWLYMKRPLASGLGVELTATYPSLGGDLLLYRIEGSVPQVAFVSRFVYSRSLNEALEVLTSPGFLPAEEVVVAGSGPEGSGLAGSVRPVPVARGAVETWSWHVEAEGDGAVLIQKTFLPIYKVEVDGVDVEPWVANMHRIAVPVGPGAHTVTLSVDRRPLRWSLAVALLTAAGLVFYLLGSFGLGSIRGALTRSKSP